MNFTELGEKIYKSQRILLHVTSTLRKILCKMYTVGNVNVTK